MGTLIDLTGKKKGRLSIVSRAGETKSGSATWNVVCECGTEKVVSGDHLNRKSNTILSCGCYRNERIRETCSPDPDKTAFNLLIGSYKKRARMKRIEFSLSEEKFKELTKGDCHYCGSAPAQVIYNKPKSGKYVYSGIDRISCLAGYVEKNCVSCCKECNYFKRNMTAEEFIEHAKKISKHQT